MKLTTEDIFNRLQMNKPVSIVRAGDGEKILLDANKGIAEYQLCVASVLKRQLGFEPTMSEAMAMRDNLITAYHGADIVGIPMQKNLSTLNKHWQAVENTVRPYMNTDKVCSIDIGYDLLNAGYFEKWLTGKDDLVYISCRNLDIEIKRHFNIKRVHSYIIPPEAKFTTGYEGEPHYPYHYNKMEWWLNSAPCKGNPCLVGAGVIGKIYTNWMRDRGGIAFDIGSIFDEWAGRVTRGPDRGVDKVIEKGFKL